MTTYVTYGDPADGEVRSESTNYVDARLGSGTATRLLGSNATDLRIGQEVDGSGVYSVRQSFIAFDLAWLPDTGTVASATLSLYRQDAAPVTNFVVQARLYDWGTALTTGDFVPSTGLASKPLAATYNTVNGWTTGRVDLVSDAGFPAMIDRTGFLRLVLCSSRQVSGFAPVPVESVRVEPASAVSDTNDPRLTVVVTEPAGFIATANYSGSKTTGTTVAGGNAPPTWAVDDLVFCTFAMDPATGTISAADSAGNTWGVDFDGVNGSGTAGVRAALLSAPITSQMANGTLTITHPSCAARAAGATRFAHPFKSIHAVSAPVTGNTASPSVSLTTTEDNCLVIAILGIQGPWDDAYTNDANGWSSLVSVLQTSGGSATTNVTVRGAYKLATAAGTVTWAPTIAAREWVAGMVAYSTRTTDYHTVASVNDGDDAYVAQLRYYRATGVVDQMRVVPQNAATGTKRATFNLTLANGTVRTAISEGGTDNEGATGYLTLTGDGVTVTEVGTEATVGGTLGAELEVTPFAVV